MSHALLVDEGFWEVLEPLLPKRPRQRTGRPRVSNRAAFTAIVFVLVTGVPWRMVPKEIGCSGVTAWRRLMDWQAAGVWESLHRELLRRVKGALVAATVDEEARRARDAARLAGSAVPPPA